MPVQPNLLERIAFFVMNAAPGVLLDLAGAMAYRALSAAVQLDIFPVLADQPCTPGEVAHRLNLQERGTAALLQSLVPLGYLVEENGRYATSRMTQKWLLDNEAFDSNALLAFWDAAMAELWSYAPEVIRTGERPYDFYDWVEASPTRAHSFQQTLVMTAYNAGPGIAKKLKLPNTASRLLDLGGGHGVFSIMMCEYYPKLRATVLDSHPALETARKYVAAHRVQDRITLQGADLWTADWGRGYDVILLFNLLHHFDRETNVKLLHRTARALEPGGKVAILDQLAGDVSGSAAKALTGLMALQYHLFADGRVFTRDDLTDILTQASFVDIQFHSLAKVPITTLVTAVT